MAKLGLIAGAGGLPGELVRACNAAERPVFVLRLLGLADPALANAAPGVDVGLAEWGKMFQALKRQRCERICFVGGVPRPDFANLKPDLRGIAALPRVLAAARKGDDALLRQVMHEFEQEGFVVEGADTVISGLTIGDGPLGRIAPRPTDTADIDQALRVARALGSLDIGQAVVVANGLVLAVEAQEGTDAMLQRCADLPRALRSHAAAAAGVLAKRSSRSRIAASTYRPSGRRRSRPPPAPGWLASPARLARSSSSIAIRLFRRRMISACSSSAFRGLEPPGYHHAGRGRGVR